MLERKMFPIPLILGISLACQTLAPSTPTQTAIVSPNTEEPVPATLTVPPTSVPITDTPVSAPPLADIRPKLQELGGTRCTENFDFTCVTIRVPLDHFDPSNTETRDVVFAVAPAGGERYGMFVQAFPGGPGGEGISTGGLSWFSDEILEHYDIVYFDQRGVGLSSPLSCPAAYSRYFLDYLNFNDTIGLEGYDTPEEQQAALSKARSFVDQCVSEIGIEPSQLVFYGTDQVAEDLETFRQAVGDEKFMLYGVSYGTAVAQTYAASHADHLSGLILDGTMDLTQTGEEKAFSQVAAFNEVLLATLQACNENPDCASDFGGDAIAAYDELAGKLAEGPIVYDYRLSSGKTIQRAFTFNQLDFTVSYMLYSIHARSALLHALADAHQGNILSLVNQYYDLASIDPVTGEYYGNSTFSDTMYYSVWCTDDSYYSGTPEERGEKLIEAGQVLNGIDPRLDLDVYPLGLACAFWPSSPSSVLETPPLTARGLPTFVLNATLDPATPFHEGKSVFERLDNGFHLYVEGGQHSIYGWGRDCPDGYITDFLVNGILPSQREISCPGWDNSIIDY
jgi:pimeloyl-ACP methyl ester carboxylesterase